MRNKNSKDGSTTPLKNNLFNDNQLRDGNIQLNFHNSNKDFQKLNRLSFNNLKARNAPTIYQTQSLSHLKKQSDHITSLGVSSLSNYVDPSIDMNKSIKKPSRNKEQQFSMYNNAFATKKNSVA